MLTSLALAVVGGAAGASAAGVTLTISDVSAPEGSSGTSPFTFTVQAAGALKGNATVQYASFNGTATAPADYGAAAGTLNFDRKHKTRTVTIQVVGDTENEANEIFEVRLSNATGASISDGVGVGTILNDDAGVVDPTIAAAGDIACDPANASYNGGQGTATECRQLATSNLLLSGGYAAVLTLGDNQYEDGAYTKYTTSYDPSWGRVKASTKPVPGNHEYVTANATGYFQYFGPAAGDPAKGYYSYDVGTWHLIALNSNCASVGGCGAGSPQEQWLRADLGAHANACTLAYWHHPRFSSGSHGNDTTVAPLWQALYDWNADVVLAGHDHDYERFAPQDPFANADSSRGLREIVVGTGGRSHYGFSTIRANSQVRDSTSYGILELTLHPTGYDWRFVAAVGSFFDSGSAGCH